MSTKRQTAGGRRSASRLSDSIAEFQGALASAGVIAVPAQANAGDTRDVPGCAAEAGMAEAGSRTPCHFASGAGPAPHRGRAPPTPLFFEIVRVCCMGRGRGRRCILEGVRALCAEAWPQHPQQPAWTAQSGGPGKIRQLSGHTGLWMLRCCREGPKSDGRRTNGESKIGPSYWVTAKLPESLGQLTQHCSFDI